MRSFAGARFHCKQLGYSQREAERMAGDYIPRPDRDFDAWQANFISYASETGPWSETASATIGAWELVHNSVRAPITDRRGSLSIHTMKAGA